MRTERPDPAAAPRNGISDKNGTNGTTEYVLGCPRLAEVEAESVAYIVS